MSFWAVAIREFVEVLLLSGVFWFALARLRAGCKNRVLFWAWMLVAVAVLVMMWTVYILRRG
jgi:hypothetical protein